MEPRFVQANGVRFAYFEAGRGPLVLLVHGFPDTAYTWDRVMQAVAAAGFRAVAPFQRGYHPTEIPADGRFDAETLARDLLALVDALGERRAVLVGHDWGASAAYAAAALDPARVRLLVTIGIPHPRAIKPTPRTIWNLRHFFVLRRRGAAARIRRGRYAYVDELWRRWSPAWSQIPAGETAAVKAAFAHPGCLEAACAYYRALSPRLPAAHRAAIAVPTVTFAGEHDRIAPRKFERARRCYTGPYEVVRVPGGHFLHREHPEPFIAELLRVLRRHDGGDTGPRG